MIATVTAGQMISLNEKSVVSSVLQNISIILSTRRGTVPLDRSLGLSAEILDRPIPVARTLYIAELREIIELYEPRAKVKGVTFTQSDEWTLIPTVEVEIDAE